MPFAAAIVAIHVPPGPTVASVVEAVETSNSELRDSVEQLLSILRSANGSRRNSAPRDSTGVNIAVPTRADGFQILKCMRGILRGIQSTCE